MQVSARNAFQGKISSIRPGAVNSEVELVTAGGDRIVAVVTEHSVKALGLAPGKEAMAFVKAPLVILLGAGVALRFSARNQLQGTVQAIVKGAVNSEVTLSLPGGSTLHSVITNDAVAELGLAVGGPASALIKASHVILGVPD